MTSCQILCTKRLQCVSNYCDDADFKDSGDTDDNRMATTRSMITGIILSTRFRTAMTDAGFTVAGEEHAICPVCIFIRGPLWLS